MYINLNFLKQIVFQYNIIKILVIVILIIFLIFSKSITFTKQNIKIALCAVGKKENLYIPEFIEYYINLGIDHFFIYDDNDPNTEKISDAINPAYKSYVTIYENLTGEAMYQAEVYNDCYKNNNKKFDWLLMIDIDEFLYITKYTLKKFLTKPIFNKCDFIKFNWVIPTDNNLIYYDNRTLFERFKGPYKKSPFVKSIIRGNIPNLKYMVHSPVKSPVKNITCNSSGKQLFYKIMNFEYLSKINIKGAYIIHFKYKSTEEYIKKYKRSYRYFKAQQLQNVLNTKIDEYLMDNKISLKKLEYLERELNLNLTNYKKSLNRNNKNL
jgi:hypothetical protein